MVFLRRSRPFRGFGRRRMTVRRTEQLDSRPPKAREHDGGAAPAAVRQARPEDGNRPWR